MKVSKSYPTCSQLKKAKNLNKNSAVSNVSNLSIEIDWGGGNTQKRANRQTIGEELDTLDTLDTGQPKTHSVKSAKRDRDERFFTERNRLRAEAALPPKGMEQTLDALWVPPPPEPKRRQVALNETGTQRIGEDHANAKLTDAQVDEIRDLYEEGAMGYRRLAARFGVSKRTIRDIVNFTRRNHWAGRWKTI